MPHAYLEVEYPVVAAARLERARQVGLQCIELFDSQREDVQREHHLVTCRFLDPGGALRPLLNSFVETLHQKLPDQVNFPLFDTDR